MFLVNSRSSLVSATLSPSPQWGFKDQAPLLPKLRGHFAEFLNHESLVRLGILCPTTCVGLGYGRLAPSRRGFSRHHRITLLSPTTRWGHHHASPIHRSTGGPPDLPRRQAARLNGPSHKDRGSYHCASPLLTRLPTSTEGPQTTTHNPYQHPERHQRSNMDSSVGQHPHVSMVGTTPVREYQPVIHRLRLSASP